LTYRLAAEKDDGPMRIRTRGRWLAAALCAAGLLAAGRLIPFRDWVQAFGLWIAGLGPAAFVLYALAYVAVTVLLMPAVLMTVGAGFFFGLLPGAAVVSVGATLGASASFLIARYLARERVARYVGGNARYTAIDRAIGRKGWRIIFLLRLSPLAPFVVSNYFYGLTAVRFWPYVLASGIGMLPLTFLYVSFGAAAREVAGAPAGPAGPWKWALLGGGVLVTLAATLYAGRVVSRAVRDEEADDERRGAGDSSASRTLPPAS
jgi:uncharacterized membrane protein YdjX (TVP38/TMEM64 family)